MARRRSRPLTIVGLVLAAIVLAGAGVAVYYVAARDRTLQAPPVCAPGPTVRGIDVSYYQESIAWKRVRKAGFVFAFIRAFDGTTPPDPKFTANWTGAKQAGVLRGAYQYFRPREGAVAQADVLIAALAHDDGELPPVLDVEITDGLAAAALHVKVAQWVARVRDRMHVEPIIYTAPGIWPPGESPLGTQPLWVAHYTDACPAVPALWKAWAFWQYSEHGEVPGIAGKTDLDVFAGSYTDLEAFASRQRRD